MSDENEQLPELEVELLRLKNRELRKQVQWLRKFNIALWVAGTLGMVVFSQALSFGRWNEFTSVEDNFNNHSWLVAGCGLSLMLVAMSVFALHKRLQRVETRGGDRQT